MILRTQIKLKKKILQSLTVVNSDLIPNRNKVNEMIYQLFFCDLHSNTDETI